MNVVGVDVGASKIAAAGVVSPAGEILSEARYPRRTLAESCLKPSPGQSLRWGTARRSGAYAWPCRG
jgi:hypothetical protein